MQSQDAIRLALLEAEQVRLTKAMEVVTQRLDRILFAIVGLALTQIIPHFA